MCCTYDLKWYIGAYIQQKEIIAICKGQWILKSQTIDRVDHTIFDHKIDKKTENTLATHRSLSVFTPAKVKSRLDENLRAFSCWTPDKTIPK